MCYTKFLQDFCTCFVWFSHGLICSLSREHIAVTLICWYNICISGPLQLYLCSNIIFRSYNDCNSGQRYCIVHRWVFIHVNVCLLSYLWCFSQIFLLLKGSRSCLDLQEKCACSRAHFRARNCRCTYLSSAPVYLTVIILCTILPA